jgi:hypothetical protein
MFFNPVVIDSRPGYFRPAVILRCLTPELNVLGRSHINETDTSRYHGGEFVDEVAALVSLALGMRLQAGGINRQFDDVNSPGRPIGWQWEPPPPNMAVQHRLQLPGVAESHQLSPDLLSKIERLDLLSANEAAALIKAARTYQEAIWIAESQPELCWLLLVSCIEAVSEYAASADLSAAAFLKEYWPDMAEEITRQGGPQLLDALAPKLKSLVASFRKFRDFLLSNLPESPARRSQYSRILWTVDGLKPVLRSIYDHRSRALHDGTPFPLPMCQAPPMLTPDDAPPEMPLGLAMSGKQGSWLLKDTPVLLHVFEYLVRGALVNWWSARIAAS